jgi:DNA-binding transcriptional MerR regulator
MILIAFCRFLYTLTTTFAIVSQPSTVTAFLTHIARTSRASLTQISSLSDKWQLSEEAVNMDLITALTNPQGCLVESFLVGQSQLLNIDKNKVPCVVLAKYQGRASNSIGNPESCLLIPVTTQQLKLLSFAVKDRKLSKSILLGLNPLLIDRDGALFDNFPWHTWTIDPQLRNRDAANNTIDQRYHFGKRDAFSRFGGKDWKGRSISIGNIAMRLKHSLEQNATTASDDIILALRLLDLQITEIRDELAEAEYQLAIARQSKPDHIQDFIQKRDELHGKIKEAESSKEHFAQRYGGSKSFLISMLDNFAELTTKKGLNAAPYRGAMGYAPYLDSKEDVEGGILPFSSPFGLMKEILEDQCRAQVIGSLLEKSSLLDDNLIIGGAIIVKRTTAKKTISIAGEKIDIRDESEDFGNTGVLGGETILVECDVDEAIGMSLACNVPLLVENEIWDLGLCSATEIPRMESEDILDTLPLWIPNKEVSLKYEGNDAIDTESQSTSPLRIPRTTASLFDSSSLDSKENESSKSSLFPQDNPIKSLLDFDSLSVSEKARTLLSMSNFVGTLPKPRVLRLAERDTQKNVSPLDEMLLPLLDESVRRQILMRDAERRGDFASLRELEAQKSTRQTAMEMFEEAKENGDEVAANYWKSEIELYSGLRADITQDEGSYNRFLDQDEWYARDRQNRLKKVKKEKFGTLLKGIE